MSTIICLGVSYDSVECYTRALFTFFKEKNSQKALNLRKESPGKDVQMHW